MNLPDASPVEYEGTRMYVHKATDNWVVIYHGNAGSACDRSYYLNYFSPKNFSYIIVEYAGYSNDKNSPSQSALMQNVEAANNYIKTQNPTTITVIGESLGTALASYHSKINPPNKLLLISPFDSLSRVSQSHYWFYPTSLMLLDKFPAVKWVKGSNNVLIIQGTMDTLIPNIFGQALYEQISGKNKSLIKIPGAGHNDIYDFQLTVEEITKFLK
ncbi:MAG TPA: alpha/beta hydrolase [Patescibacteria group bacterium]|nr:alpha/beta hydrolase [Patescibacteria group bacterium]